MLQQVNFVTGLRTGVELYHADYGRIPAAKTCFLRSDQKHRRVLFAEDCVPDVGPEFIELVPARSDS